MKMAAALPSSWEELPPDLLGLVLHRLPSLADRVHLRAVCRPWRAGAQPHRHKTLPPPLPWLALRDGTLVDLNGAHVRCAPILREGVFRYLSVDNLAFLVHDDGGCSLMNPLSGLTLALPKLAPAVSRALENSAYDQSYVRKTHAKVILSSPLDLTPDPLVAVIIRDGFNLVISPSKHSSAICISLPPERPGGLPMMISDIVFFHGELYALTVYEGLHIIKVDANGLSKPKFLTQCIADDRKQQQIYSAYHQWQKQIYFEGTGRDSEYMVMRYTAQSNGRLLMVRRWMSYPQNARLGDYDKTFRFDVFEADLTTVPGRWTKVENLGGQALFLDSQCTKSVLASQCAGGVKDDCIYFMHTVFDNPCKEYIGPCVNPLADSGVYNMRDGKIMPLLPEVVMGELQSKRQFLTWFFPADA